MTKKNKIWISILSASTLIIMPPITLASIKIASHQTMNSKYSFMGKTFNSKEEAIQYAISNASKTKDMTNVATSWTLKQNNMTNSFESPDVLINALSSQIKTFEFVTNKNELSLNVDGSIIPNELKNMDFSSHPNTTKIYRGANNGIYTSEKAAKDSYYEIHQVYFFDNLFFRAKNELAVYLEKNWEVGKKEAEAIILKSANQSISLPIKIDALATDLDNPNSDTYQYIEKYIRQHANGYLSFAEKDNKRTYYSHEEISRIGTNKYDPNYTQITSNKGKGNYIVDLDKKDEFELLGPYYVESSSDIKKMKDPSLWKKISGRDSKFVDNALETEKVTHFFDTIISRASDEHNNFFNIPLLQSEIDQYFNILKNDLPKVYASIENIFSTMKKGKRYSEFLKLPILFLHTIDEMISYRIDQHYIDLTRKVYNDIAKYYDLILKLAIPRDLLKGRKDNYFSFEEMFKFNNKTLDLNYDVDTIVSNLVNNFQPLVNTMDFIGGSLAILNRLPFLTPNSFQREMVEKLFNITITDEQEESYRLIWNALTSGSYSNSIEDNVAYLKSVIQQIYQTNVPDLTGFPSNDILDEIIPLVFIEVLSQSYNNNAMLEKVILNSFGKTIPLMDTTASKNEIQAANEYLKTFNFTSNISPENVAYLEDLYEYNQKVDVQIFGYLKLIASQSYFLDLRKMFGIFDYKTIKDKILDYFIQNVMKNISFEQFTNISSNLLSVPINALVAVYPFFLPNIALSPIFPITSQIFNIINATYNNEYKTDVWNIFKEAAGKTLDIASNLTEILEMTEKIAKLSKKIISIVSTSFIFVQVAVDFLLNFYKVELSSYIFKSEDVEYIWKGGKDESFFFGLIPGNSRGPEAMKLLDPLEVIGANIVNGYYYNGVVYNDIDTLRAQQLDDVLEGRYHSDNAELTYSLVDLTQENNIEDFLKAPTLDDLVIKIINKMKTLDFNHPDTWTHSEKEIFGISDYTYGNGFYVSNSVSLKENINNILNKIKPVWISQLPLLNLSGLYKNMPISDDNAEIDPSICSFELPNNYWTSTGGIISSSGRYQYVLVDPNIVDQTLDDNTIKQRLDSLFYNSFDVPSKSIVTKFVNKDNHYSDLSDNINHLQAYMVENINGEEKIFLDKNDAINWLMNKYDYQAYYTTETHVTYTLNQQTFYSYNSFLNWIENNIKEVK